MKLTFLISTFLLLCSTALQAAEVTSQPLSNAISASSDNNLNNSRYIHLAADESGKGQRCMMVCEEWGEDCVLNPQTKQQDCRRVCVKFGEQCF